MKRRDELIAVLKTTIDGTGSIHLVDIGFEPVEDKDGDVFTRICKTGFLDDNEGFLPFGKLEMFTDEELFQLINSLLNYLYHIS